ncbi:conserved Plasmodium protein, unknown function [Plasmodium ovale]|uniref:Uncharacterized protein n=1 Tax=Plasmodium ovale TaxID=36330 RepID=A0A1C3L4Q7_PLAOA|nr:conserved Plasmodium protein, unknown function [Plasmodium ovale]
MEDLKRILWSVEELVYAPHEEVNDNSGEGNCERSYAKRGEELATRLTYLYQEHFTEKSRQEGDNDLMDVLRLQIEDMFILLRLVKLGKHEKCIVNPWVRNIFGFILQMFKNGNVTTIDEIKKELFEFILREKKEKGYYMYSNVFMRSCLSFFYEIKILLCCCIFLNIFVQYNWTGPPLHCHMEMLKSKNEHMNDESRFYREFLDAIQIRNENFLNSCLEFLSLEGEYTYEHCEVISSFCLCIMLLGLINNFNHGLNDETLLSVNEYAYFENCTKVAKESGAGSDELTDGNTEKCSQYVEMPIKEEEEKQMKEGEKEKNTYDTLKLLYFVKSKYLWKARIYFIWQRLYTTSNNDLMYTLKVHIVDKPLSIFKNIKLLPIDFELVEQEISLSELVDVFDSSCENLEHLKYCDLFFENYMSHTFKIYILSNFSIYLTFYNYTYAYEKIVDIISEWSNFQYTFTGRMGIKRKYQKIPATILVLKAKLGQEEDNTSSILKEIDPSSVYDILRSDYRIVDGEAHNGNVYELGNEENLKREDNYGKQNEKTMKNEAESGNAPQLGNHPHHRNRSGNSNRGCSGTSGTSGCCGNNENLNERNEGERGVTFIGEKTDEASSSDGDKSAEHGDMTGEQLRDTSGKVTWKLKDLDPDTDILEEPYFVDSQNNYFKILNFQEQITLINYCFSMVRFNPHYDEIKFEKLSAVISRCLKSYDVHPVEGKSNLDSSKRGSDICKHNNSLQMKYQNWLLHSCILWYKCKYETFRLKTVDRAAAQLNELLKECYDETPECSERMKFIYDIYYPTTWEMKKEIGNVMIKTGSVVSAFNIFKDLKLWEEAITCLIEADRKEEAKELLDDLLQKKKKNPGLLCLYGLIDRSNSLKYYIDAWNLSNCKYAKAARYIGKYYYDKEMYTECCEYLEKALEISPLFPDIWFILGYSYMKINKFDGAIKSFTRMISMTNENSAKSYGNLAYLYMKKGTYKAAKICINQAVKVNNNEWKYWDTYLKLSILQNDVDSFCLSISTICKLNQVKQIQSWVFDYISDLIVKDKPTMIPNKTGLCYLDKIITTMNNISVHISEYDSFWNAYSFFLFIKGEYTDAFESKVKEIRSIESMIQKCTVRKLTEGLILKEISAIKFLYHLVKTHITEKRTFVYQLKNLIESVLRQYSDVNEKEVKELLEMMRILK